MKNIQLNGSALSLVLFALFPAPASAGGQDRVFKCMIAELHPTQLAVGMAEVREKEHKLSKMDAIKLEKYKEANPEPTAKGPGGALYIIDHHHLALALFNIGVRETYCAQAADYSGLETSAFWGRMEDNKWVYAYDEYGGGPRPYSSLPAAVSGLKDDPYRSLAGAVRNAGGYDKVDVPFAEFKWADYFRDKFSRADLDKNFSRCVKKAVKAAHLSGASSLPGWHGQ